MYRENVFSVYWKTGNFEKICENGNRHLFKVMFYCINNECDNFLEYFIVLSKLLEIKEVPTVVATALYN